jgi:hypothetical protein
MLNNGGFLVLLGVFCLSMKFEENVVFFAFRPRSGPSAAQRVGRYRQRDHYSDHDLLDER